MTAPTTTQPQAWHRLHYAAGETQEVAQRVAREELPGYQWPDDVSRAIGKVLCAMFDVAFQAGRDSRGPIADADRLWAVHVPASDDIVAHPSRESADTFVRWAAARDAETAQEEERHKADHPGCLGHDFPGVYLGAYAVEWPFTPDEHAEALTERDTDGAS